MKAIKKEKLITDNRVYLSIPSIDDMDEFITKAKKSKDLHSLWVLPPQNQDEYTAYLKRTSKEDQFGCVIRLNTTDEIVGVININNIVLGSFQSGYLGYYCFKGYEKQGLITDGLNLLISYAFNTMKLHRLEANIQPQNTDSLLLMVRCGFIREGFSKRYLKINNKWEDHIRYALIAEDYDNLVKFQNQIK